MDVGWRRFGGAGMATTIESTFTEGASGKKNGLP
jgi:hypothetical protein